MIRLTPDTGFSDMIVDGQGPRYHYWRTGNNEDHLIEFLTLPTRDVERDYIPEFSEVRRHFMLPTSTGLDAMSFEDQVRFIYSTNSFLGGGFRPIGRNEGFVTLVHSALDNRPFSPQDWYINEALNRAQELFLKPENFTPESLSELRRIADKYRIFQKYQEYEYWLDLAGWKYKLDKVGMLDVETLSHHGAGTFDVYNEPDRTFPYGVLLGTTWRGGSLPFILKSCLLDFGATIADWAFIWFHDKFYRLSRFDRLSTMYYKLPEVSRATQGGCGIQTTVEPMKEDPGNYVMD